MQTETSEQITFGTFNVKGLAQKRKAWIIDRVIDGLEHFGQCFLRKAINFKETCILIPEIERKI